MKQGISFTFVIAALLIAGPAFSANAAGPVANADPLITFYETYGYSALPDAAGEISVTGMSEEQALAPTWGLDEITVYPGFPVNVTSWAYEGGTYCNMDADADLEVLYYIGQTVYALNLDGTNVPGWPQTVSYYSSGAPAVGDIDGDEDLEIVVASQYGSTAGGVDAFELDGTDVTGFPITPGYVSRSPVLSDLDGDGALEIIVNKRAWPIGELSVYRGDGTLFPGWPYVMEGVPGSSSAVGDITGDDIPEIVGESLNALYAWDINGNLLDGFPYMLPTDVVTSYSSPVLVDLDEDGFREIVFGTHSYGYPGGYVYILRNDGTDFPGWPQSTNYWIYGPPAVGYVDGDNVLDIVVGDQVGSPIPTNFIYGWDAFGNTLSNFPIGPLNAINNQVALADLDGDGMIEMVIDDNTMVIATYEGKYLAYNHDGTPLDGWPVTTLGTTMMSMVCLTDVNNDGFVDMIGAGSYASEGWSNIYLWNTDYAYDPAAVVISTFQYNVRHDGLWAGEPPTPPELAVTLTPVNPPIVIPAGGGSFDYTVQIANTGAAPATFDGWIEAVLPSGTIFGPIILRESINVPVGGTIIRTMTQEVPANARTSSLSRSLTPGTV
jgi:hypothetical protein